MRQLEKIVWPHVRAAIINEINTIRSRWEVEPDLRNSENRPIVVLEAAILVDAGWDQDCDGVWVVSTSKQAALARLIESRGLTEIEALKRIKFQEKRRGIGNIDEELKSGRITCNIQNSGSKEDLIKVLK